jgi:hypothetical protein
VKLLSLTFYVVECCCEYAAILISLLNNYADDTIIDSEILIIISFPTMTQCFWASMLNHSELNKLASCLNILHNKEKHASAIRYKLFINLFKYLYKD